MHPKLIMLSALSLIMVLTACSGGSEPTGKPSLVEGASSGGTLTIGVATDNPGLGLKTGDGYAGFDIDTATYVAAALGVPAKAITWRPVTPATREKVLTAHQVDLVVANYSITDERRQQVDFAGPYFIAHQTLLVRRNETEITGPDTLDDRVLCSVKGTTSSAYIRQHYKGKIELKEFDQYSDCVQALIDSSVDAVTTDDIILAGFAAQPEYRGKLKVLDDGFTDEQYGIAVGKGQDDLVTKINKALTQYIDDGSWKASLEKYVRPSGYQIPSPPTPG